MSRNEKDESPQTRAEDDEPAKEADDSRRDPVKLSGQLPNAPSSAARPDLDWAEHED